MIMIHDLQKSYQQRTVLQIEELSLPVGKRYALIGPNGAGKSTLLKLLAGVLSAERGKVSLPPDLRQHRGYMPQKPYAFDLSVRKNVQMSLDGLPDAAVLAERALRQVGLWELADARGSRLSGGESQRMALARMIARPRKLLLLDEPTSATDLIGSGQIEEALTSYWKQTGCTLFFATHSLAQAYRLADQVLLLADGKLVESGSVEQVLKAPVSPEGKALLRSWSIDSQAGEAMP